MLHVTCYVTWHVTNHVPWYITTPLYSSTPGENTFSEAFRTRWTAEEGSLKASEAERPDSRPDSKQDIKRIKANATVE